MGDYPQERSGSDSARTDVSEIAEICQAYLALCEQVRVEGDAKSIREAVDRVRELRSGGGRNVVSSPRLNARLLSLQTLDGSPRTFLAHILLAIEQCADKTGLLCLSQCLEGFLESAKSEISFQKRVKRLVKQDATHSLIKALRDILKEKRCDEEETVDALHSIISLMITVSMRDRKFALKTRLTGLLQSLAACCFDADTPISVLSLVAHCARAPRNSYQLGRASTFNKAILEKIENSGEADFDRCKKYLEIVFFLAKNKKIRLQLIDLDGCPVLLDSFRFYFDKRNRDDMLDVALVALGCLRQLTKSKSGKDALVTCGGLEACETALRSAVSSTPSTISNSSVLGRRLLERLTANLCALCMRCLPPREYPLAAVDYPFHFKLPSIKDKKGSAAKQQGDSDLSEDEPEDEVEAEVMGEAAHLLKEYEDEEEQGQNLLPTPTKQMKDELDKNYRQCFVEFASQDGTSKRSSTKRSNSPVTNGNGLSVGKRIRHVSAKLFKETMLINCQRTKRVIPFAKVAFPEAADGYPDLPLQPLKTFPNAFREKIMDEVARYRNASNFDSRTVYDLDKLSSDVDVSRPIGNDDLERVGKKDAFSNEDDLGLVFESRFEGGNLRRVERVGPLHYELFLSPDVNESKPHHCHYYFQVSNNVAERPYTFELVNCQKHKSLYSEGMQPLLFSVTEAKMGRPGWVRAGYSVCYYRNQYGVNVGGGRSVRASKKKSNGGTSPAAEGGMSYYSARFIVTFRHPKDICYLAFHMPYTYSYLMTHLDLWSRMERPDGLLFRQDKLCDTLGGNSVVLLTITDDKTAITDKHVVFLSARVHPGEANASWMMHGVIRFLISSNNKAVALRQSFLFKIVPMLNPDGVINGSHRCSLAGVDLNRQWADPNAKLHPTIFHTKGALQYLCDVVGKPPLVYCDFHGHSRKFNVFMYGNNPEESWWVPDHAFDHHYEFTDMPEVLDEVAPGFRKGQCRFSMEKDKEACARVSVWRHFGILRSYTIEASYCGFSQRIYAGYQVGTRELIEMGECFCEALLSLKMRIQERISSTADSNSDDATAAD